MDSREFCLHSRSFLKPSIAHLDQITGHMSATKTKVIVVGAGIAGPVLAAFLKLRGYEPTVYERVAELPDSGLGHL